MWRRWLGKWPWKPKIIKSLTEESLLKEPPWVLTLLSRRAINVKPSAVWVVTHKFLFYFALFACLDLQKIRRWIAWLDLLTQVLSSFSHFYPNIEDNVWFKCGGGTLLLSFYRFLVRFTISFSLFHVVRILSVSSLIVICWVNAYVVESLCVVLCCLLILPFSRAILNFFLKILT